MDMRQLAVTSRVERIHTSFYMTKSWQPGVEEISSCSGSVLVYSDLFHMLKFSKNILSRVLVVTIDEIALVNRFIDHVQIVTTNNYNSNADFHIINNSILCLLSLLSLVFTG
jgi:hypothetical protein